MSETEDSVRLAVVIEGVLQALQAAKYRGDAESARLCEVYKSDKSLIPFSVPAYTIADVEVELKFAVVAPVEGETGTGQPGDLRVKVRPEALKGLEPHHISVMKVRFAPVNVRVFEP
jgi:hypothetical protein